MSAFDAVDLNALPAPDIVEALDFETILTGLVDDLRARLPVFDALVESDPGIKLMEVVAFHALILRQRVNDATRAVMLAHAAGADLDNLAALFDVARQTIDPGDPVAIPPVPATLESDAALRRRAQLALEAATAAGTAGRYLFYALGADPKVADAAITSPAPGDVLATILSIDGDGTADQALLDAVTAVLTDPEIRQLNDTVLVAAAAIVPYDITATLFFFEGATSEVAMTEATARLQAMIDRPQRLGRDIARSAIFAALHVEGVSRVDLTAPAADIVITPVEAASAGTVTLIDGGVDE